MHKRSASNTASPTEHDTIATAEVDDETSLEDTADDEYMDLYAVDLYEAAGLDLYMNLNYRDALKDAKRNLIHDYMMTDAPSLTSVADVSMPVILSEIIATQKTDDLLTFFATMGNTMPFFL